MVGMHLDDWALRQAQAVGKPGLKVIDFADLLGPAATQPWVQIPEGDPEGLNGLAGGGGVVTPPEPPLPTPAPGQGVDPTAASAYTGPNNDLWMDPLLTDQFIYDLDVELKPFFPGQLVSLHHRVRLMRAQLLNLHQEMVTKLSALANKRMVTYGNAFDLLARRYGLQVIAHLKIIDPDAHGEVALGTTDRIHRGCEKVHRVKTLYAPTHVCGFGCPGDGDREEPGPRCFEALDVMGNLIHSRPARLL